MWAGDALGYLLEERLLYFDKLRGLNYIQDLLQLPQEHHLRSETGQGGPHSSSGHSHVLTENRTVPQALYLSLPQTRGKHTFGKDRRECISKPPFGQRLG